MKGGCFLVAFEPGGWEGTISQIHFLEVGRQTEVRSRCEL